MLTAAQARILLLRHRQGASTAQLARQFDVFHWRVRWWINRHMSVEPSDILANAALKHEVVKLTNQVKKLERCLRVSAEHQLQKIYWAARLRVGDRKARALKQPTPARIRKSMQIQGALNEIWSMDYMTDVTTKGNGFWILTSLMTSIARRWLPKLGCEGPLRWWSHASVGSKVLAAFPKELVVTMLLSSRDWSMSLGRRRPWFGGCISGRAHRLRTASSRSSTA